MSKRRGKLLTDEASIERRNWYSGLQQTKIEEVAKEKAYYEQERKKDLEITNYVVSIQEEGKIKLDISPWIVSLNQIEKSSATILCFHGMGQNHGFFKRWGDDLKCAGIQLLGVCLPGRSNRAAEPNFTSIRDISIAIFLALKSMKMLVSLPPKSDYSDENAPPIANSLTFFGHDVGSLIAYEVAKLLQDYRYNLTALIVSSSPSPYHQGQNRFGKKMCFLSDTELLQQMIDLGGVPETLLKRTDMLKYFLPLFRTDYYLYDKYTITPPAAVLTIPESHLEFATDALLLNPPDTSSKLPSEEKTRHKNTVKEENTDDAIIENPVYPVVLYRLRCKIVSLCVADDPFVSLQEVAEWAHLCVHYDHVTLESVGPGGHMRALCENYNVVLDVMRRCSGTEA